MDSVLEKLASLAVDESTKLVGLRKQVRFLHRELSSMRAALDDIADMEDPDNGTKEWRNQVIELAYDTEDCIDDFRHRVEGPHDEQGFMCKAGRLPKKLMARYQISKKIAEIKTRVQEVSERHTRYRLDGFASRSAHVSVDPRITAFYADTSSLVGIDAPKEEVIRLLTEVDDASMQELRVVSIVGFGGLGKTTLANEVYRDLSGSFTCKAIISVSQRPEMTNLLKSMFSKVSGKGAEHINDLKDLIDNLREYLLGKRYLLVVDDLWDASAWESIKCAFPESHCGSRVLTTTRIENVAGACCNGEWNFVYRMKPLDFYHSGQLFLRRTFGLGDKCPEPFKGPYEKILQKCGGLPLAIITIASLLASQPTRSVEQWEYVLKSLRHNLVLDPTFEGMRQILNLSYTHLPNPLKACLLYIGMYPEDYEIKRDDLVFQWVAEGFINGVDSRDATEMARSYLNELVNRSMIIQHVEYGQEIRYRVHDMVLDLILYKSTEENFFCVVQNLQEISMRQQQYKARRLTLQFRDRSQVESATCRLPHVRSLLVFGRIHSLGLLELKFLRVLYIEEAADNLNLTFIGKLFQLRYLSVHGSYKQLLLPKEIRGLRNLEALCISSSWVSAHPDVPRDIFYLPALLHLHFPLDTAYPDGFGNLKCLHTLRGIDISKQSLANIWALGELLNLRVLDLSIENYFFGTKEAHMDALLSSLEKLFKFNLKILSIFTWDDNLGDNVRWNSLGFSGSHLEQLHLRNFELQTMPPWDYQLRTLSSLEISVKHLCKEDVALLARLPALARLVLGYLSAPHGEVMFSAHTTFNALGYLGIPDLAIAGVTFEAGSMSHVDTLAFKLRADDVRCHGVRLAGIEHLPSLKQVIVDLFCIRGDESERSVKAEIRSAFDGHPACSSIQIMFDKQSI